MLPTRQTTGTLPSVQEPGQTLSTSDEQLSHVAKCPIMTPQNVSSSTSSSSSSTTTTTNFTSTPLPEQPRSCPVVHTTPEMKEKQIAVNNTPAHLLPPSERLRKALCSAGFASIVTTMITGAIWQPIMTILVRQQFISSQKFNISLKSSTLGVTAGTTATTATTTAATTSSSLQSATMTSNAPTAMASKMMNNVNHEVKSSMWSVARGISNEGKRVFFRGLTPRLMQSPLACVQWTTYEMFRETLANKDENWSSRVKYAAVFILARALTTAAKCPFEVIKERMQVQGTMSNFSALSPTSTTLQHFRHLIKTDGFFGLFKALPINICRDIPIAVLMMVGNDFWTHLLLNRGHINGFLDNYFAEDRAKRQRGQKTPTHISFMAGALSGLVATLVTQPIDVAKTVIQTQSLATLAQAQPITPATTTSTPSRYNYQTRQFTGMIDVLRTLKQQQGIKSWFVGTPLRATHLVLGGAVYLPLYRKVQQQLKSGFDILPKQNFTQ